MTSKLEKAFRRGYNKYLEKNFNYIAHTDFPTKKKAKQFPDVILTSEEINYCFELKFTTGERMRFRRLKKHQEKFLLKFQEISGESYVLMGLEGFENIILMNIEDFLRFKNNIRQKSFTIKHFSSDQLEKIGLNDTFFQRIHAERLKKHYRLDLNFLIPNQSYITSF